MKYELTVNITPEQIKDAVLCIADARISICHRDNHEHHLAAKLPNVMLLFPELSTPPLDSKN